MPKGNIQLLSSWSHVDVCLLTSTSSWRQLTSRDGETHDAHRAQVCATASCCTCGRPLLTSQRDCLVFKETLSIIRPAAAGCRALFFWTVRFAHLSAIVTVTKTSAEFPKFSGLVGLLFLALF